LEEALEIVGGEAGLAGDVLAVGVGDPEVEGIGGEDDAVDIGRDMSWMAAGASKWPKLR
jgi:hypothetical protein